MIKEAAFLIAISLIFIFLIVPSYSENNKTVQLTSSKSSADVNLNTFPFPTQEPTSSYSIVLEDTSDRSFSSVEQTYQSYTTLQNSGEQSVSSVGPFLDNQEPSPYIEGSISGTWDPPTYLTWDSPTYTDGYNSLTWDPAEYNSLTWDPPTYTAEYNQFTWSPPTYAADSMSNTAVAVSEKK
jgi:hypothetical protein